jgi:hypothetical protein
MGHLYSPAYKTTHVLIHREMAESKRDISLFQSYVWHVDAVRESDWQTMNREQLLTRLDNAWAALGESYAGLTEAEMLAPGVAGDWSVKDMLAHVATWEEEALKYLPLIINGGRPPRYASYGGIDAFNARMTEAKRQLSLAEVERLLEETHRQLIAYLRRVPEEQFTTETRFRHRLRLDTYSHYPLHATMIRTWREQSNAAPR